METKASVRKPAYAGQFYPADKESLQRQIEECFSSELGPGSLPGKRNNSSVKAAIVPHAGYIFSGPAAAFAYKEIGEAKLPDLFLILGTNHSSMKTCLCDQDYETPLGVMKTDRSFVELLAKEANLPIDNKVCAEEHSAEVQIPFIQFASKDAEKTTTKIVVLLVSREIDFEETAKRITEAIKKSKKNVTIIVSSDFTHYGFNYDYVPFPPGPESRKNIEKLDFDAISLIEKMDAKILSAYAGKTRATICGIAGILLLIELLKCLYDKNKAEVLKYYTSTDVVKGYGSSVSYAAILFK